MTYSDGINERNELYKQTEDQILSLKVYECLEDWRLDKQISRIDVMLLLEKLVDVCDNRRCETTVSDLQYIYQFRGV